MPGVAFEEMFVCGETFLEIGRRGLLTPAAFKGCAVLALLDGPALFFADIEPRLRIMGEADGGHVLALQKTDVGFGKCARFADFGRDGASGRIDGKAAKKNGPSIENEIAMTAFKGAEAETDSFFGQHFS